MHRAGKSFSSRAFILPIALALGALIAGLVLFCAGLVRHSMAAPQRAMAAARTQALYGLDVALAQLQSVVSADTVATAPASLLGGAINSSWVGAWAKDSTATIWLVSGYGQGNASSDPSPYVLEKTQLTDTIRAPLVTTSQGTYAYAIEDLSQKIFVNKMDRLDSLQPGFGDSPQVLRQQSLIVPAPSVLSSSQKTPMSYGLLTNPIDGGLKADVDVPNAENSSDSIVQSMAAWRDPLQFIQHRPLVWSEAAVLLGVFRGSNGVPQLAINFWANAWNPYTQSLPFNTRNDADLRVRLVPPPGNQGVIYLDAAQGLVGFDTFDLSSISVPVDVYGPMAPGEVRFITEYSLNTFPGNGAQPNAQYVKLNLPAGNWSLVFETLDGQPIQTIQNINFSALNNGNGRIVPFTTMVVNKKDASNLDEKNAQAIYSFKIKNRLNSQVSGQPTPPISPDPRAPIVDFSKAAYYSYNNNPVTAQTNYNLFSGSEAYRDKDVSQLFDLPDDNTHLVTVGTLYQMPIFDPAANASIPAFSLGGSLALTANQFFDKYFFSSLPADDNFWTPSLLSPLPNANLRLTGSPTFNDLKASPAQSLLVQGAFNINTPDVNEWAAMLPSNRSLLPFRSDASAQTFAIADSQRQAWAQAIVARLQSKAQPWRSLSDLANENILPPDVFGRVSALLQPRGDTFIVHVYATASGGVAALDALVQRLPTSDGTGRRFQVLLLTWVPPHAQS